MNPNIALHCATSGKSLNPDNLSFLNCKMGLTTFTLKKLYGLNKLIYGKLFEQWLTR